MRRGAAAGRALERSGGRCDGFRLQTGRQNMYCNRLSALTSCLTWHLSDPYGAGHREPAYWGKADIRVPDALVALRGHAPGVSAVIHWVSARRKNGGSPTVSPNFQPIAFTSFPS
jgi:hypothetical protein